MNSNDEILDGAIEASRTPRLAAAISAAVLIGAIVLCAQIHCRAHRPLLVSGGAWRSALALGVGATAWRAHGRSHAQQTLDG